MAGRGNEKEVGEVRTKNQTIVGNPLQPLPDAFETGWTGNFIQRAREHLRAADGFEGSPAEFESDPHVQRTSSGAVTVHFQQQFKSVPIFSGAQTVRFSPEGKLEASVGNVVAFSDDLPVQPQLTAARAVLAAAQHVTEASQSLLGEEDDFGNLLDPPHVDLTGFQPTVLASFPETPEQATVLAPGPFGHAIKASLVWYPEGAKLRLGWDVLLTMPLGAGQYRVIVDASAGSILFSRQLMDLLMTRGNVHVVDGDARQMISFPRPWTDYAAVFDPGTLPSGVPPEPSAWVDNARRDTVGNCVNAHLGDDGLPLKARDAGGDVVFDPAAGTDDQKVLNIFYYNCYLHDLFYLVGFREEDGNFQQTGIGGVPGDAVDARAHSGAVWGTANMFTPPDGTSPTMNMGLVPNTNKHTAFDATVVFHEYMHGVTNRLVGGPLNTQALQEPQSKAMGEGWGDYLACTLTNRIVVGSWVTNQPNGIRSAPYDSNYAGRFGQLGQGIYTSPHRVGEIWCAALLEMNRNLNARLGTPRGQRLAFQLVVDALKLAPANPNMLEMRDAILKALDDKRNATPGLSSNDHALASSGIWAAFAKFGMGVNARSNGAKFGDVVEDVTVPGAGPSQPDKPLTPPPPTGTVRVQDNERVAIPDGQSDGISRVVRIDSAGTIKRLTVHVDINHPYVGDLRVALTPPGRTPIVLHNLAFTPEPDLVRDYTAENTPPLAALIGQPAHGGWTLAVSDQVPGDNGALRGWGVEVEFEPGSGLEGFAAETLPSPPGTLGRDAYRLLEELNRVLGRLVRASASP